MDLGLRDRVAVVGGSSSGIGYAIADRLLREGASVLINGRDASRLADAKSRLQAANAESRIATHAGDLCRKGTAEGMISEAQRIFGRLDILIINSGGPPPGDLESMSDQAWLDAFEGSILAAQRLVVAALPLLGESEEARVVAITSISVKEPVRSLDLSNCLRPGVAGMIRSLASRLGDKGTTFNCVAPGYTRTRRLDEILCRQAAESRVSRDEIEEKIVSRIPVGRLAEPSEVADVVVFLTSRNASFINGQTLFVDGGQLPGV